MNTEHWWDGTWWAVLGTDVLAVKNGQLSVYPPEIPSGLPRDQTVVSEVRRHQIAWALVWLELHCIILRYVTCYSVGCVVMCKYCVCVCSFMLCDFVLVCTNIYVAIYNVTCKAHQKLCHCLFSTWYSEHQLLYHVNCKHLL